MYGERGAEKERRTGEEREERGRAGAREEEGGGGGQASGGRGREARMDENGRNINPYRNRDSPHILRRPPNLLTSISQ